MPSGRGGISRGGRSSGGFRVGFGGGRSSGGGHGHGHGHRRRSGVVILGGGRRRYSRTSSAVSLMALGVILVIIGVLALPSDAVTGLIIIVVGLAFMLPGILLIRMAKRVVQAACSGHNDANIGDPNMQQPQTQQQGSQIYCQRCGQPRPSTQPFCGNCGAQ